MAQAQFDSIRPYSDAEFQKALARILSNPDFKKLVTYLLPGVNAADYLRTLSTVSTIKEFQLGFIYDVLESIVSQYSDGLSADGFENLDTKMSNVFIANHRDIVLDSSLLCKLLVDNGFEATEITWGDNLMVSPLVVDLGKSNRMITVYREGSPKEMFKTSMLLSSYIHDSVTNRNQSVWIAQRKGRSKDGNDTTDISVLKMLSLSGGKQVVNSISQLNIVPVTISYEWEPCDSMKVRELCLSDGQEYIKEENEDFKSIVGGVISNKGRIHLNIGKPINKSLEVIDQKLRPNEILEEIAKKIDKQVRADYKLWPCNYLAYDLLEKGEIVEGKYDEHTVDKFNRRLQDTLKLTNGDKEKVTEYFLKLYANPVYNQKGL